MMEPLPLARDDANDESCWTPAQRKPRLRKQSDVTITIFLVVATEEVDLLHSAMAVFTAQMVVLRKGLICSDKNDLGIQVDDEFSVIDADGKPFRLRYAIGPLLKGSLWESTAVPELRGQAMRVAEVLLQRKPLPFEQEEVIEYYI